MIQLSPGLYIISEMPINVWKGFELEVEQEFILNMWSGEDSEKAGLPNRRRRHTDSTHLRSAAYSEEDVECRPERGMPRGRSSTDAAVIDDS